jgi:D-3-phosphoglycerate dehydrogenase
VQTGILYNLLQQKKLLGIGLDVLEQEPLEQMSPKMRAAIDCLAALPEVIITPHIAGYSVEALFKMSRFLLEQIQGHTAS